MLMQEFTNMTGFEPTPEEYKDIEAEYCQFDGDKQAFCKNFVERGEPARLYKRRANHMEELGSMLVEKEKEYTAHLVKLTAQVAKLQEELDRELEWKPTDDVGTHMSQEEYEDLAKHGEVLSTIQAEGIVCREYGFGRDRVAIKCQADTYEVNKYRQLRVKDELARLPVYSSADWNYIRFDCAGYMYEMVNGELMRYEE